MIRRPVLLCFAILPGAAGEADEINQMTALVALTADRTASRT
ncbi:hypothetical protein ACU4GH_20410 [Bradyrhizobium betae]|nr:hypothetical protein [Bradyrhizobium sp. AT1]